MRRSIVVLLLLGSLFGPRPSAAAPPAKASAIPAGVAGLQGRIAGLLNTPSLSARRTGIVVVSLASGERLYGRNGDVPLLPASNQKILTSAAAMALLGPDFAFRTALYTDGTVTDGILGGTLYLKGFGDPDLDEARLATMAEGLREQGVHQVSDVVADDSFFDEQRRGLGWRSRYEGMSYSAKISALSISQNVEKVWVTGTTPGKAAQLRLEPATDYYQLVNQVRTVPGWTNRIGVRLAKKVAGRQQVVVTGAFGTSTPPDAVSFNIDSPALVTGGGIVAALREAGITVTGRLSEGRTPASATPLVINASRPLTAILTDFNKHSVNFIGEHVFKYLGATFRGEPGTAAKGADVVKEDFLRRVVGVDPRGMVLADGSGLSPLNRLTANQLAAVLRYMHGQPEYRPDFQATLPTAGVDGTLRHRFRATPAQGVLRAKTGFINGVVSLSGYTQTRDGEPVAFSFLMNDYKDLWAARVVQDRLGVLLTVFQR